VVKFNVRHRARISTVMLGLYFCQPDGDFSFLFQLSMVSNLFFLIVVVVSLPNSVRCIPHQIRPPSWGDTFRFGNNLRCFARRSSLFTFCHDAIDAPLFVSHPGLLPPFFRYDAASSVAAPVRGPPPFLRDSPFSLPPLVEAAGPARDQERLD